MADEDTSTGPHSAAEDTGDKQLAKVALKRVAVSRADADSRRAEKRRTQKQRQNPMNRLVPYLDLLHRLTNEELSRLAEVSEDVVLDLRGQAARIKETLAPYAELLPRLSDEELSRMTGAPEQTVRFWRLCRPASEKRMRELAAKNGLADVGETTEADGEQTQEVSPSASHSAANLEGVTGDVFPGFDVDDDDDDLEIGNWVEDDDEELELEGV